MPSLHTIVVVDRQNRVCEDLIKEHKSWKSLLKVMYQIFDSTYRPDKLNLVIREGSCGFDNYFYVTSRIRKTWSVVDSFAGAVQMMNQDPECETAFAVGGPSILQPAFHVPSLERVWIFRVDQDAEDHQQLPDMSHLNLTRVMTGRFGSGEDTQGEWECLKVQPHEEIQYLDLVRKVMEEGVVREDRTGTGTMSLFGPQFRFSLRDQFPLMTTKRVHWKSVVEELLWFLRGDTNSDRLHQRGVRIWDANGSRKFLDARGLTDRKEGDLGPIYGWQWRHFGAEYMDCDTDYTNQGTDQLAHIIHLLKTQPNSRRILLTAWDPTKLNQMALPPCHVLAQFYVSKGELSCHLYQRSADLGLGVPFNVASYSLLTCLLAHICHLKPGDFVHSMGDAHVYLNHKRCLQEQLDRNPRPFPKLHISDSVTELSHELSFDDFVLEDYHPHPAISMPFAL